MKLPEVLRNRDFNLYWAGVVLSQIGSRGAIAANFYQVYQLTGSVAYTGLVGAGQAVALLVLSPLGGALADRVDRRRLLQAAQAAAMLVAVVLAWLTVTGRAQAWHVVLSVVLTTAAATFDQPARQALIPALVPRSQIGQAVALLNPSRELAVLVGPLTAGVLIAVAGPGLMYVVDAVSYALLVAVLALLRIPALPTPAVRRSVLGSIVEGGRYISHRPLIYHLMALDLSATVFGAYRVLLPVLAVDVLHVGAAGYGALSGAPSAGALLATYGVFRTVDRSRRQGRVLLVSTALYGVAALLLAWSPIFVLAIAAAGLLGACDAMATTIRHAAVQIDTPDELRGRVTAFYQMSSRGGPAIGDVLVGAFAGLVGPVAALTVGAFGPILVAASYWWRGSVVRSYTGAVPAPEEANDAATATAEVATGPTTSGGT
ncbi:MFS transporter [Micromonospora yasonensis]|uniref:MFS transporter n=1 Tax=Micromonospora yasonensis TaxID=1128667 RepID=UPI00222E377A|nr:MFS transporter [Micromonospora yasonensis]MCW3844815.1 MFS transporter [Micromonospora yasonensis]